MIWLLFLIWLIGGIAYVEYYKHVANTYFGGVDPSMWVWSGYVLWPILLITYYVTEDGKQVRKYIRSRKAQNK